MVNIYVMCLVSKITKFFVENSIYICHNIRIEFSTKNLNNFRNQKHLINNHLINIFTITPTKKTPMVKCFIFPPLHKSFVQLETRPPYILMSSLSPENQGNREQCWSPPLMVTLRPNRSPISLPC